MNQEYLISREQCPSCLKKNFKEIYKISYNSELLRKYFCEFYLLDKEEFFFLKNQFYFLLECNYCKLIYQKEIPNEFLSNRIYEKWIDPTLALKSKNLVDQKYYYYFANEISQILISFFNDINTQKLKFLDFGMGWGVWAEIAKSFGINSYGFDLSKQRTNYAAISGIKIIEQNEISGSNFDFINTEQVFEHLPNPYHTLSLLKSGLKKNGIIKISVPYSFNYKKKLKLMDWSAKKGSSKSLNFVAPLEHINYYQRNSILKMGKLLGFEEVKIPLLTQYLNTNYVNFLSKHFLKNVIRPFYRNFFNNYIFLKKTY